MKRFRLIFALLIFGTYAFGQNLPPLPDLTPYLPEIRDFNKGLANFPKLDLCTPEALAQFRAMPSPPPKLTLKPQNKTIPIASGNMSLRIFKPQNPKGILIDIHGGGWCIGNAESNDARNEQTTLDCQMVLISIDYKLAPENPIPNQITDCADAITWILANAKKEFGTEKIVIQGNSAGSHLAVSALLKLKGNDPLDSRIKGLNLLYGVYDLSKTPSARQVTDNSLILSKHNLGQFWKNSVEHLNPNDLQNPAISPLYANLSGLPPALFSVGTADGLIDDTNFMAARWQVAGNKMVLDVYPECSHLFDTFPTKIATLAKKRMANWVLGCVE